MFGDPTFGESLFGDGPAVAAPAPTPGASVTRGPLPFLAFCGVEVANAARTISYMRAGLGDTASGRWETSDCVICGVLARINGGTCDDPEVFADPATDPAPWYDPYEPGSATFLGVVMLDIKGYDSTITRQIAQRSTGLDGGTWYGQHRKPREWKFRAALVSSDDAGAEFGLRWLTSVLQSSTCDTCETCDLVVRLLCPPDDCSNDVLGEWIAYDTALTEGPTEVEPYGPNPRQPDVLGGCRDWVTVEWTMMSGNPFLYKRPVACIEPTVVNAAAAADCTDICAFLFAAAPTTICCEVIPPRRGVLGGIFTISSTSGMPGLILEAYDACGSGLGNVVKQLELSSIPANSEVIVDCARHVITVTTEDPVTGTVTTTDGRYLVDLPAGASFEWIEVRSCDDVGCFCARPIASCAATGGDTYVSIEVQAREG